MNLHRLLQLFYLVTCYMTVLRLAQGNENNIAKFTRIDCLSIDKEYLTNVSCRVKAVRRDLHIVNIEAVFIRPAHDVLLRLTLFKKANTFKPFLVDVTEDLCDFLSKRRISTVMRVLGTIYMPYSNVNSSCPLVGKQIFKDMPLDAKSLPSIWPTGEYRLNVKVSRVLKTLVLIQFYFALEEKVMRHPPTKDSS